MTKQETKATADPPLDCLVRWLWPVRWVQSRVITCDNIIYIVRDAPERERQILCASDGKWRNQSIVTFSYLPCFEDWHRAAYYAAKPYSPNA